MEVTRFSACELSDMLEEEYGQEFNVPYHIMQDQRKILHDVSEEQANQAMIDEFKQLGCEINDLELVFECLVNDLCFRGKLKPGEYMFEFDD